MVGGLARKDLTETDRDLAEYLRKDVAPYSPQYGRMLRSMYERGDGVTGVATLVRLPFTRAADIADPSSLVLRPDPDSIGRAGDLKLIARLQAAKAVKREASFNLALDRAYKPLIWWIDAGLTLGASSVDERRLGSLGRQWLEGAGVRAHDSLVSVVTPGPSLAFWHLWLAARSAGLSALYLNELPSADDLIRLQPAALAGSASDLLDVLAAAIDRSAKLANLRTLLVVGEQLSDATRERLEEMSARLARTKVAAVAAWAPPGARALWAECRGGRGVHLWPGAEVVEVVDDGGERVPLGEVGEIVWTPIGWHGSVLLRFRTGVIARIDTTPCETCGARETVFRVEPSGEQPAEVEDRERGRRGLAALAGLGRGKRRG